MSVNFFVDRKDKKSLDDSEFNIAERLEYDEVKIKVKSKFLEGEGVPKKKVRQVDYNEKIIQSA